LGPFGDSGSPLIDAAGSPLRSAPEQGPGAVDVAERPVRDELVEPGFGECHNLVKGQLGDHVGMNHLAQTEGEQPRPQRRVAKAAVLFEEMPRQEREPGGLAAIPCLSSSVASSLFDATRYDRVSPR